VSTQNSSPLKALWSDVKQRFTSFPAVAQSKNGKVHRHEFIVVGLGRFGTSLAMSLNAYNHDVLAVDADIKRVQEVSRILPHVTQLDATNIEALREAGVEGFETGIACIGTDFEANLLATVSLRKLGVRRVMAKAHTTTQQEILQRVGADEVILPEHEAGVRLGRRLAAINLVDFLELSDDKGVVEVIAPDSLVGQSLKQSQIRQRYDLTVIAIRRQDEVIVSPVAEEVIRQEDILVVLGSIVNCERLV
jgi:trk system potassium uptake protein TrkA